MRKITDLTGRVFERLKVIERSNQVGDRPTWSCMCDCGSYTTVNTYSLTRGLTKSCGCLQKEKLNQNSGKKSHRWKGGRQYTNGYVRVYLGPRNNGDRTKYILEHIKIMEEYLGRKLTNDETVHHKNGVKDDNHLDNLELWSSRHPKGQRVSDKVSWAVEILRKYKPELLGCASNFAIIVPL